ncbi:hypothetical protein [Halostella salina]|uniref:hypothetical protein n=1 Tax=Halostella salina TaxID=1547897 RepID=UPI000EF812BE|nr:hypothetical protein [Halostella salina]
MVDIIGGIGDAIGGVGDAVDDTVPDANIDTSEPAIESLDVPGEVQPGRAFNVEVTLSNSSEITVPQSGTCQSGIVGTNVAWRNPYRIRVDGEVVASGSKCIDGSSPNKTAVERVRIEEPGTHVVKAEVLKVPDETVDDTRGAEIEVVAGADDPSIPTAGERVQEQISDLLGGLNSSGKMLAAGAVLALVLIAVVG